MAPAEFDRWLCRPDRPPLLMGVVNVTPDSFSDGGQFFDPDLAVRHAQTLVAQGADLIDVGGESTRPGSQPTPAEEQIRRAVPVIRRLRECKTNPPTVSIDTTRAAVAEAALDAGADLVNDISAGRDDPALLPLAARRGVPVILMHMQGTPATMQLNPSYQDVVAEVQAFLRERIAAARSVGIDADRVLVDPGIGFGKTVAHNLELLRRLAEFQALGRPVVLGTSRKGFIGKITGETDASSGRLFGTAASVAWGAANGAAVLRVHDVGAMAQVVRMVRAIQTGGADGSGAPTSG
jgi:dihydropteroate synthase